MKNRLLPALTSLALLPTLLLGDEENAFARFDTNHDETVTYIEFASQKKAEFESADRDRSKTLSEAEFGNLAPAEEADLFVMPAFEEMDTDGNQTVAFREFGGAVKSVFDRLDASTTGETDGKIVQGEYLAAVQRKEAEAKARAGASAANKGLGKGSDTKKGSAPQPK